MSYLSEKMVLFGEREISTIFPIRDKPFHTYWWKLELRKPDHRSHSTVVRYGRFYVHYINTRLYAFFVGEHNQMCKDHCVLVFSPKVHPTLA